MVRYISRRHKENARDDAAQKDVLLSVVEEAVAMFKKKIPWDYQT